jgi:hypothetical protein
LDWACRTNGGEYKFILVVVGKVTKRETAMKNETLVRAVINKTYLKRGQMWRYARNMSDSGQ